MKAKKLEHITISEFEAFEKVRESGVTNMFNINDVCIVSNLDKETYLGIL